jgi:hypothetical protein
MAAKDNDPMTIRGRVQNGVVILEGGPRLPEGAAVSISYPVTDEPKPHLEKRRIEVPLVRTGRPGSLHLTGERIATILDEDDAAPRR